MMMMKLASLQQCAKICGLHPNELVAGVSPAARHAHMVQRYRALSRVAACARIVAEIREAIAIEALGAAADLLLVLRIALAQALAARGAARRRRGAVRLARLQWLPNADYLAPEEPKREEGGRVVSLDASRLKSFTRATRQTK